MILAPKVLLVHLVRQVCADSVVSRGLLVLPAPPAPKETPVLPDPREIPAPKETPVLQAHQVLKAIQALRVFAVSRVFLVSGGCREFKVLKVKLELPVPQALEAKPVQRVLQVQPDRRVTLALRAK